MVASTMGHVLLSKDDESPFSTAEVKKSSNTTSKIVSKRTIVIVAIITLLLAILVIVLGALLGAERARRKGKINIWPDIYHSKFSVVHVKVHPIVF